MGETESRAGALVRRARRRATAHGVARAVLSGVTSGALVAGAIVAVAGLAGFAPGPWPLLGVPIGLPVGLFRLRRVRPTTTAAALLLDRAADTRERFLAAVTSADPAIRELAARQALGQPAFADGRFPLRFPPSVEGLAAVLAIAFLSGALLLAPDLAPPTDDVGPAAGPRAGAPGAVPPGPDAEPVPPPAGDGAKAVAGPPAVSRIESGEALTEGDWRELAAAGLTRAEREAIRAALASGDREGAAEAARAALRRAEGTATAAPSGDGGGWGAYGRALASPVWAPRHDRVVREYFRVSAQRGLR